jgi:tetratricopeptide (TPR) repeat protein
MPPLRLIWLLLTCILGIAFVWADYAWGRHRGQEPLQMPRGHASDRTYSNPKPSETASGQAVKPLSPHLKGAGEPSSLNLLKLANVCPDRTERAAALLGLGGRAETQGCFGLAIKVYTLAALLHPDAPEAAQAGLRRLILEFYLELGGAEPYQAFRNFLAKLSGLSVHPPPEKLREPLLTGWLAVEQSIQDGVSVNASRLARALMLWEMHPPGTQPPEAALLVGRLLKKQGLFTEASKFFTIALDKGDGHIRSRTILEFLQLAWAADGLPGFVEVLTQWRQDSRHLIRALRTWPLRLRPLDGASSNPPMDSVNDLTELLSRCPSPPEPQPLLTVGDAPLWEALFSQPLPALLEEYLIQRLARHCWAQANFSQASRLYRNLLAQVADKKTSFFYWDRLGLLHIKEQEPSLAQDIFQTLAGEQTQFWQLLAHTRQFDVELSRLRAEPAL